ncbi:MAG TPA: Hsp20/alpha crystallin family protein [Egibacteraceae bacterium]|nr:Hsp20/alpha crystallin family protein [Egibacteraceae bacterium]
MAVVRWDPWAELAALQRDVGELFNRTTTQQPAAARTGLVPPIDAFATDGGLVVRVELPGMTADDVDVSVDDGTLTIGGERRLDPDVPEDRWVRRERPVGAFQRSFSLPEGTDAQKITASFSDGLLELHIPHPPERRPHRVEIGSSNGATGQTVDVQAQEGGASS